MIASMPQQILRTARLTLLPLADEHLEWEVELDSAPEVMRYLSGRASTREEAEAGHPRRMAAAQKVDRLGFWVGGEVEYEITRERWEHHLTSRG
jgi:hypothetical protein